MGWIDEPHLGVRYGLSGDVLVDESTAFQRITVMRSERYGNDLARRVLMMSKAKNATIEALVTALCGPMRSNASS